MAYISNIPMATDQLSVSQGQIQQNFTLIANVINPNNNNVTPASIAFPVQGTDPGTIAGTLQMYSKTVAGAPQLFIEREATSVNMPTVINFTAATKAVNGYTILPSGIMIQWGSYTLGANSGTAPVAFGINFPNACLNVQATETYTASQQDFIQTSSLQVNQFVLTAWTKGGNVPNYSLTVSYLAIGY